MNLAALLAARLPCFFPAPIVCDPAVPIEAWKRYGQHCETGNHSTVGRDVYCFSGLDQSGAAHIPTLGVRALRAFVIIIDLFVHIGFYC